MTDLLALHFASQVSNSYQFFSGTSKNCVTFTRLPEKVRKIENLEGTLNYGQEVEELASKLRVTETLEENK